MPTPTTRAAISKPLGGEYHTRVNWNAVIDQIDAAFALIAHDHSGMGETPVKKIRSGLDSAKPAAGTEGMIYFSKDSGLLNLDDGSDWITIGGIESPLTLTSHVSGEIPLTLVGASSQSANLLEFKNNAGSLLAHVDATGAIHSRVNGVSGGFFAGASDDVSLYRGAADLWLTPDSFTSAGAITAGTGLKSITGFVDTSINGNTGGFRAGAVQDVLLYRHQADVWRTPDALTVDGLLTGGNHIQTAVGQLKSLVDGTGGGLISGAAGDVSLYRSAGDTWKTPDTLWVGGAFVLEGRHYWDGLSGAWDDSGAGSPEGVQTAPKGSTWRDTTNGRFYIKRVGADEFGWVGEGMSIKNIQRGILSFGGTTGTATVTAVVMAKSELHVLGSTSHGAAGHGAMDAYIYLASTTQITGVRDSADGDIDISWELIEYD